MAVDQKLSIGSFGTRIVGHFKRCRWAYILLVLSSTVGGACVGFFDPVDRIWPGAARLYTFSYRLTWFAMAGLLLSGSSCLVNYLSRGRLDRGSPPSPVTLALVGGGVGAILGFFVVLLVGVRAIAAPEGSGMSLGSSIAHCSVFATSFFVGMNGRWKIGTVDMKCSAEQYRSMGVSPKEYSTAAALIRVCVFVLLAPLVACLLGSQGLFIGAIIHCFLDVPLAVVLFLTYLVFDPAYPLERWRSRSSGEAC